MNFLRKSKVTTLSDWLEIATRKLAAPAKERIKGEIESHYAESVQAHLEDGLSGSDAELAALAELGDAHSSARSFQKHHLTKFEASTLKGFNNTLVIGYIAFALFALEQLRPPRHSLCGSPFLFLLVECVVSVVLPTICFLLSNSDGKPLRARWLVLVRPVTGYIAAFAIQMLSSPFLDPEDQTYTMLFCLIPLIQILIAFRIWRKLGSAGTIQNELPPLDTPAPR